MLEVVLEEKRREIIKEWIKSIIWVDHITSYPIIARSTPPIGQGYRLGGKTLVINS